MRSENPPKEICLKIGPAALEVGGAAQGALRQQKKQRAEGMEHRGNQTGSRSASL
jgi:hypothetical protein